MKLISIEISGYNRINLRNISYIKITPENSMILILGSNGSGKSSLVKELTPMPANHNEYSKPGYKKATYETDDGTRYVLTSTFTKDGHKYSFIKDDVELNDGLTVTVFKELVKREFGFTQEVHDLCVGNTKFSRMSVSERRYWFTKLADTDYTYALSVFNKWKDRHRDIQGGIKLIQNKLLQESKKVIDQNEELRISECLNHLDIFLNDLLDRKTRYNPSQQTAGVVNSIDNDIKHLTAQLKFFYSKFNVQSDIKDIVDLESTLRSCQDSMSILTGRIETVFENSKDVFKDIQALENSHLTSFTDIDSTTQTLTAKRDKLQRQLMLFKDIKEPGACLLAVNTIQASIEDIVGRIEPNPEHRYSRESYTKATSRISQLTHSTSSLKEQINDLDNKKKELEHLREHGETTCPNCSYKWYKDFNPQVYDVLNTNLTGLKERLPKEEKELAALEAFRTESDEYFRDYRLFLQIVRSWPILDFFWSHLQTENLLLEKPSRISHLIHSLKHDLEISLQIENVDTELAGLRTLKQNHKNDQNNHLGALKEKYSQLELSLSRLNNELSVLKNSESHLKQQLVLNSKIEKITKDIEILLQRREEITSDITTSIEQELINKAIELTRLEISQKQNILSSVQNQKSIVDSLTKQLSELKDRQEVLGILIKELSPTTGLIAKGLTGFIHHFMLFINSFIKKIWSYPLELVSEFNNTNDDTVDLDYKFCLRVNDQKEVISDISLASTGMKEVIDLAFVITAMKFLGMDKYPIYLDEWSANMDSAHRKTAFATVTNFLLNSNHSQTYIISHYEDSYGALANTDVVVLCDMNIVIPDGCSYNNTVEIK
jgi:energy-coupling factor transporter ATP-binding protein EcfA2